MAFVDQTARRPSLRIALAVGLFHIGLGAALLSTFAGGTIRTLLHHALPANDWTMVPPPPRPLPQSPKAAPPSRSSVTAPDVPLVLPTTQPFIVPPIDGPQGVTPDRLEPAVPSSSPSAIPTAEVAPLRATPRGDPASWLTPMTSRPAESTRTGLERRGFA